MPSVVVPAHNEERVLGRLLSALLNQAPRSGVEADDRAGRPADIEVVVVANGCNDETATVAADFAGVRVLETPVASKSHALRLGDEAATRFPRLYVDADVVLDAAGVHELCRVLETPDILAAGPERILPMAGVSRAVRWYYDVWRLLPVNREELFGRGVIAVNEAGHARLEEFFGSDDAVMSDDLVMAMSFAPAERVVAAAAHVEIRPPRTYADLIRRRVRAMAGNAQLEAGGPVLARTAPRTGLRDLVALVAHEPGTVPKLALLPKAGIFLATAVWSRVWARRMGHRLDTVWLRDDSSRTR